MNPVQDRTVSGFQLSISTGMAMETLFTPTQSVYDIERVAPDRVALLRFTDVWINVDTLIRNILNASTFDESTDRFTPPDRLAGVRANMVHDALLQEIELIQTLFMIEGGGRITPTFYVTDYTNFYNGKDPDHYKKRLANTDKQVLWFKMLDTTRQLALTTTPVIKTFKEQLLPTGQPNALILSHIALDLLSYQRFGNLELLESHTGKVKTRREWNSKYQPLGPEKFENFPWCKPLLCWLGDKYVLKPLSITIRKRILEISKIRHWTPLTAPAAVYQDCLSHINDPELNKVLRQISLY